MTNTAPNVCEEQTDFIDKTKPVIATPSCHNKAKSRWITVEPIIFLAFVGIGTFPTIRSQYLQQRIADDVYNYTYPTDSNNSCGITNTSAPDYMVQKLIQRDTAEWLLYFSICSTLPSIFMVIVLGKWSDIKGRKVAILVSLLGMLVQSSVYVIVINHQLSIYVLYIAEIAAGFTGGSPLIMSVTLAYIADVTTTKQRTFRVVVVNTCNVFSVGVAQLAIGYLIATKGFKPPFYLLILCQVVAILYTTIPKLLYESLELEKGGKSFLSQMSKLLHGIFDLYVTNENGRRWRLLLINAIFFPIAICIFYRSVLTLYLIGQPFCYPSEFVGIYNAVSRGVLSSIGR